MTSIDDVMIEITPQVLLKAYACGIFPMAESAEDNALYWIEPERRGILPLDRVHVPKRLVRTIRKGGFEVLEWIRSHPTFKPLVVIILSSSAQESDVSLAYRLGANSYVAKPNDFMGLSELVGSLIDYWLRWSKTPMLDG